MLLVCLRGHARVRIASLVFARLRRSVAAVELGGKTDVTSHCQTHSSLYHKLDVRKPHRCLQERQHLMTNGNHNHDLIDSTAV